MADDGKADPPKPYQKSDFQAPPESAKRELTDRQDSDKGRLAATLRSAIENKATTPAPAAEAKGSQQVRDSKPAPVPQPPQAAKDAMARQAHNTAMARDNAPYKSLVDNVRKQCEVAKQSDDLIKSKDKDDKAR